MSPIKTTVLPKLPDEYVRSARDSVCKDIVDQAVAEAPSVIKVEVDDPNEIVKIYKSMIQYRTRAKRKGIDVGLRKAGPAMYVWIEKGN